MRASAARAGQSGFSLFEVLIALVIAGMALATMFRAASESIAATAAAGRYQDALSRARSHLDVLGATLSPGEQSGDDGSGYAWRTMARAVDSTSASGAAPSMSPVTTLYATTVWISWREGSRTREVRLDSHRLLVSAPE